MRIFILTDNRVWFQKAKQIFFKNKIDVSIFCSPLGAGLFEKEIKSGEIQVMDVKKSTAFLIENFELGFSCHCKQIFPVNLVEKVRCINIHPGLNPYNRGWFPQVFSIINKNPVGATIHLMDKEVDHGDILYQQEVEIFEWDTSKSVYDRVLDTEIRLFEENLNELITGDYEPQKMLAQGNYNSIKDYKALLEINLDEKLTMREAIDFLRAMTHKPYKNAYFLTNKGEKVLVALDIEKESVLQYFVVLKKDSLLTSGQADTVKQNELSTPEKRFPFNEDSEGSHLIEVYCKGTLQECQNFIATIKDEELRDQFKIISR